MGKTGVIVIGRNEADHLKKTFASVADNADAVLYVDSGSSDGSAELAGCCGASVLELDPSSPFSAARARHEGFLLLVMKHPEIEYVQFIDGDCEIDKGWLESAEKALESDGKTGIVCGRLSESDPDSSIFNRLNDIRWKSEKTGEISACGGIFMIRRQLYEHTGGFNRGLLTGEESEFCSRVRKEGYSIVRLDRMMARHDSDMIAFRDWWKRAVWGGFGDALQFAVLGSSASSGNKRKAASSLLWGLLMPCAAVACLTASIFMPYAAAATAAVLLLYAALFTRIIITRRKTGDDFRDAVQFSALCIIRKTPYSLGFLRYVLNTDRDIKRPDPHN